MKHIKYFSNYVNESSFSSVNRILQGNRDSVDTIGILTAFNPDGEKAPDEQNEYSQGLLKNELRNMGFGYIKALGCYGVPEESLIVPNISREIIIQLGNKYNQAAVIFGEKISKNEMAYDYIEGNKVIETKYEVNTTNDVQNLDDFYTLVKGRKFQIPFFPQIEEKNPKKERHLKTKVYKRHPKHKANMFNEKKGQ
jgi:hypothetical protein